MSIASRTLISERFSLTSSLPPSVSLAETFTDYLRSYSALPETYNGVCLYPISYARPSSSSIATSQQVCAATASINHQGRRILQSLPQSATRGHLRHSEDRRFTETPIQRWLGVKLSVK
ncbi:hypothetical protein BJ508DRAFT_410782 [Ascobolus immersus RN42]|uniref:Uncharacterized protein n=1 Tax=Ascobolus immersus RN42 TaxID=1160509 RepID=A0A3N4IR94_ASCIM|nr:hypothetical protein BJ508DRAFT_410782 [Ascobolus immersus RN42]